MNYCDYDNRQRILDGRNYARTLFIGMAESDDYVDPREAAIINKIITQ